MTEDPGNASEEKSWFSKTVHVVLSIGDRGPKLIVGLLILAGPLLVIFGPFELNLKALLQGAGLRPVVVTSVLGRPKIVFPVRLSYPHLRFSVVNGGEAPIQITAIRVVKAASIKANYSDFEFVEGARTKLEFSLRTAAQGAWSSSLEGRVFNLARGEAEAFEVDFTAENSINLVDLEVEYVGQTSRRAETERPGEILFVSAPYANHGWSGSIQLLARSEALLALLENHRPPLRGPVADANPGDVWALLLRGASHLCPSDLKGCWEQLSTTFHEKPQFGPIAASFAELGGSRMLPPEVADSLESWARDPEAIRKAPIWDNESHASIVQNWLISNQGVPSPETDNVIPTDVVQWLTILDGNLQITRLYDDPDLSSDENLEVLSGELSLLANRKVLLRRIIDRYKQSAVEYLIVNLRLSSVGGSDYEGLLTQALGLPARDFVSDDIEIQERWARWWREHKHRDAYSTLRWRAHSPRLARAAAALFASESDQIPGKRDELVRLALARNPELLPIAAQLLAQAPEPYVRLLLAMNGMTPPSVLATLSTDTNSIVRREVASNPRADDQTLELLSRDASQSVRDLLKQKPRLIIDEGGG